jgi:hypothetical protein
VRFILRAAAVMLPSSAAARNNWTCLNSMAAF